MESYHDQQDEARRESQGSIRRHPYAPEGEIAHYDFTANPDLIPEVLEDFKPHSHRPGVQKFYRLLRYLNGPRSILETSDSLFRGPEPNATPHLGNGAALQVMGRFMVIFRDHNENLNAEAMHGLCMAFREELALIRPGWPMGCIGTAFYWAWFSSLSPVGSEATTGKELVCLFWAWGNDEAECFDNFGTLMQGVGVALCNAQKRYAHWVSLGRPSLLAG